MHISKKDAVILDLEKRIEDLNKELKMLEDRLSGVKATFNEIIIHIINVIYHFSYFLMYSRSNDYKLDKKLTVENFTVWGFRDDRRFEEKYLGNTP